MNIQTVAGSGDRVMVTIAKAAQLLSASGDPITAPNVSRYVARFPDEIASQKKGRERLVDIESLMAHRRDNSRVADKQSARGVEATAPTLVVQAPAMPAAASATVAPAEDSEGEPDPGSLGELNRELKKLELRRRQREEDEASGRLIDVREVHELISTTMAAMITALEQQEPVIAQRYGREIAASFRRSRKDAQAVASRVLMDRAKRTLQPSAADAATDGVPPLVEDEAAEAAA